MRKNRTLLWMISLLLLAVMVSACGGNDEPTEVVQPEVVATEVIPVVSDGEPVPTATEGPELGTYGQPIDVPIMDGNRDLQISRGGENIGYKIDTLTLQEVYNYYREQLDILGWLPGPNEVESVRSQLVTIARANEVKDRITVTMQHNSIGEFTVITIVVNRAP